MLVIVPSNRAIRMDYLAPLIESGARFIIVDDSEGCIKIDHPQFQVFNWQDRRRILGPLDDAFPRRNGSCRAFGFYLAWRVASPGEAVIALDDDCLIRHADFAARVEQALSSSSGPVVRGGGLHWNILDLYEGVDSDQLFPRGFPYSSRRGYTPWRLEPSTSKALVRFQLGMWRGVFDVNAVDKLTGIPYAFPDGMLREEQVIVPAGVLVSVCSMNMQFRAELIPAVIQAPMHIELAPKSVIDRYGDIWGGFILKTLMDRKGDHLGVGGPVIEHMKEGNLMRNIWQENLCHTINDEFITLLLECGEGIQPAGYLDMVGQISEALASRAERASPLLRAYLGYLTAGLSAWEHALRGAGADRRLAV